MKTLSQVLCLSFALAVSPVSLALDNDPFAPTHSTSPDEQVTETFSINTVRALYLGTREVLDSSPLDELLGKMKPAKTVAIFEVIHPLAYQKSSPYGSPQMIKGQRFAVELNQNLYAQQPELESMIAEMAEKEEVVVKLDEIYLFNPQEGGQRIQSATRMARRNNPQDAQELVATDLDEAPVQNILPMPQSGHTNAASAHAQQMQRAQQMQQQIQQQIQQQMQQPAQMFQNSSGGSQSHFVSFQTRNGQSEKIEVFKDKDANTGEIRTRMFINDVEVDPDTKEPLKQANDTQKGDKKAESKDSF